jgi:hypothetical protein
MSTWFLSLPLAVIAAGVSWLSWQRARKNQFYSDTPLLWPLGIFVWGDGMILGPFWVVSAIVMGFMPWMWVLRYLLVFYAIRAGYEVIYWINHQVAQREYRPPLFRRWSWIGANEAAILYQLLNTCQVVAAIVGLLWTFTGTELRP